MILATTTSTRDSGLLDVLVPDFERGSECRVKTVAVGSGDALKLGERGDADVLLVHSPAAEEAFMRGGPRGEPPGGDAQRLRACRPTRGSGRGSRTPPTPRRPFGASRGRASPFASRADDSGTNAKELEIREQAGIRPRGAWYVETGQGMGETLTIADQKRAYTLSDRGTFLATKNLDAKVLVEGGAALRNPYHVIVVRHEGTNAGCANDFSTWISTPLHPAHDLALRRRQIRRAAVLSRRATLMDPVGEVLARSAAVSISATLIALTIGVPLGTALALARPPGRRSLAAVVNTGMAVPTVVVGLLVALLLWRSGPLGELELIYTLRGMVIAQVLIATPLIAGITMAALQSLPPELPDQLRGLGANRRQTVCVCGSRRACPCWRPRWRASGMPSRRSVRRPRRRQHPRPDAGDDDGDRRGRGPR